ncbi:hypothetical protein M6C35_001932 [Vibrio metschnikovii]|nr:hypothetical protein [Vibrio metschnikovii]
MNKTPLISVSKRQSHDESSLIICNTDFPKRLPSSGLTALPSVDSYRDLCREITDIKQVFTLNYFGHSEVPTSSVTTMNEVKKSDFINLYKLSKEVREPIYNRLHDWLNESENSSEILNTLLEKNLVKQSKAGSFKLLRTELYAIVATVPEFVEQIIKLSEFRHLDAIRYGAFTEKGIVELITVFNDRNLMYIDESSDAVVASATGFKGDLLLPKTVQRTGNKLTQDKLRLMLHQQSKVA